MAHQTILITGASSGLGLAFLKWYVAHPPSLLPRGQQQPHRQEEEQEHETTTTGTTTTTTIIALDNQPFPNEHAHLLGSASPGKGNKANNNTNNKKVTLHFHQGDITSAHFLHDLAYHATPIHLLIHCAGIRGLVPRIVEAEKGNVATAETLDVMDHATMMRTFEINTWGTMNLVKSFLPGLRLAAADASAFATDATVTGGVDSTTTPTVPTPKVIILSSRMGSVASNTAGGGYAYRASKAALNAVVKSFSLDVPEVVFALLHPGRVETGLVQWKEEGAISVEESLRDCLKIIEGLGKRDSGKLVDRFGVEIPW